MRNWSQDKIELMKKKKTTAALLPILVWLTTAVGVAQAETWRDQLKPFLQSHCIDCHDGADAEDGLDLSGLGSNLSDAELMRRWVLIHDRVSAGEMPPKDETRPAAADQSKALATLAAALTEADRARSDVVLRRLNRNEYENRIRDLFDVHVRVKDILPEDAPSSGFDNVGEGLAVSAEAAGAYLRAADVALDAALGPAKKPEYVKIKTNLLDQKDWLGADGGAFVIGGVSRNRQPIQFFVQSFGDKTDCTGCHAIEILPRVAAAAGLQVRFEWDSGRKQLARQSLGTFEPVQVAGVTND